MLCTYVYILWYGDGSWIYVHLRRHIGLYIIWCVVIFMINLRTKFHTPNSIVSLAIFISPNVEDIGIATIVVILSTVYRYVTRSYILGWDIPMCCVSKQMKRQTQSQPYLLDSISFLCRVLQVSAYLQAFMRYRHKNLRYLLVWYAYLLICLYACAW